MSEPTPLIGHEDVAGEPPLANLVLGLGPVTVPDYLAARVRQVADQSR